MTIVGFIRHGETDWNREGRAQGQFDVALNTAGIDQAKRLAERMANDTWDYIYSSDLSRARKTAELVAESMGKTVQRFDVRLREKSHGMLDGTTEADRIARWGDSWRQLDHKEETKEQLLVRSLSFLEEVCAEREGSRILIVSHGAWIRTTIGAILPGLDIPPLENTSLSIVRFGPSGWDCVLCNCSKHLAHKGEATA